jgi:hypothetical protein
LEIVAGVVSRRSAGERLVWVLNHSLHLNHYRSIVGVGGRIKIKRKIKM